MEYLTNLSSPSARVVSKLLLHNASMFSKRMFLLYVELLNIRQSYRDEKLQLSSVDFSLETDFFIYLSNRK